MPNALKLRFHQIADGTLNFEPFSKVPFQIITVAGTLSPPVVAPRPKRISLCQRLSITCLRNLPLVGSGILPAATSSQAAERLGATEAARMPGRRVRAARCNEAA
jgi:hypothetical protein